MLTIATLFWQGNVNSYSFSAMYDESWVEKLYRGFARNLSKPFHFVCYVDRPRDFLESIEQRQIKSAVPSYADCIQPYELDAPMILCGLDTIVCGNIDALAQYCFEADKIALPRDPYHPQRACNGVALVPAGQRHVADKHSGENDMYWMRKQPHVLIDDLFPDQVVSFKGRMAWATSGNPGIVYFHGDQKPHQLKNLALVKKHWR